MKSTIEIKYVAYVTTEIEEDIATLNQDVWPPVVTLTNGKSFEINTSSKLSEDFVQKISIHPKKKVN